MSFEEFGQCADVASAVDELISRLPRMLFRVDWERALETLASLDPDAVIGKTLAAFSMRKTWIESVATESITSHETVVVAPVEYKR